MNLQKAYFIVIFMGITLGSGVLACERGSGGATASKPDFSLQDIYGKPVSLKDYRGKLVLLNLWATWCTTCIIEMPSIERLYQTYKDKGLAVLAVTTDPKSKLEKVREFVETKGLSFTFPHDPKFSVPQLLEVSKFPETVFIGPDGNLLKVYDPEHKREVRTIVADRPWDSEEYLKLVGDLLAKHVTTESSSPPPKS